MNKITIAMLTVLGMSSFSAHAWGDREQGALAGILGTILWQKLDQQNQQAVPPVIVNRIPQSPYPVVVQETVIPRVQQCTPWREFLQNDGTILRERTCYQR
jgi:hypothetical protein